MQGILNDGNERLISTTVTATGTSFETAGLQAGRTYQASVDGSGAVSATVVIEVSNDDSHWLTLVTFTLSGTATATDGVPLEAAWSYTRAKVTAISGTGATATAYIGA